MRDTYNCDYLQHSAFLLQLNRFSVKDMWISLPSFAFFTVKSPSVTQKSVSQEMLLKRAKTRRLFSQNYKLK